VTLGPAVHEGTFLSSAAHDLLDLRFAAVEAAFAVLGLKQEAFEIAETVVGDAMDADSRRINSSPRPDTGTDARPIKW
jgi:hypothetical protein